jgi:hypothetical protein
MATRLKKTDKKPDSKCSSSSSSTNEQTASPEPAAIKTEYNDEANRAVLAEKLDILGKVLKKSFKYEFIDSICQLIKLENQSQAKFNLNLDENPTSWWPKLEYFLHQLKKIIKHKSQLLELINNMQIHHHLTKAVTHQSNSKTTKNTANLLNEYYTCPGSRTASYLNLTIEFNDFTQTKQPHETADHNSDYFLLTNILVRLLFKLINYSHAAESIACVDQVKMNELRLLLLSSLADLSFYEEIRTHVCIFLN